LIDLKRRLLSLLSILPILLLVLGVVGGRVLGTVIIGEMGSMVRFSEDCLEVDRMAIGTGSEVAKNCLKLSEVSW